MSSHSFLSQCLHCYGCYVNKTLKLLQVERNLSRVVMISSQLLFFREGRANVRHHRLTLQHMCPSRKSLNSFLWSLDLASLSASPAQRLQLSRSQHSRYNPSASQPGVHCKELSAMGCVLYLHSSGQLSIGYHITAKRHFKKIILLVPVN